MGWGWRGGKARQSGRQRPMHDAREIEVVFAKFRISLSGKYNHLNPSLPPLPTESVELEDQPHELWKES